MIVPDSHRVIELLVDGEKDYAHGSKGIIPLYGIPFHGKAPYILCPRNIPQSDQNRGISSRL